jgi:hypothetical protein
MTSGVFAKAENGIGYKELGQKIAKSNDPYLLLFGTGWGMEKAVVDSADLILEAIKGGTNYRHLSVRSAAAIVLDRLLGERKG